MTGSLATGLLCIDCGGAQAARLHAPVPQVRRPCSSSSTTRPRSSDSHRGLRGRWPLALRARPAIAILRIASRSAKVRRRCSSAALGESSAVGACSSSSRARTPRAPSRIAPRPPRWRRAPVRLHRHLGGQLGQRGLRHRRILGARRTALADLLLRAGLRPQAAPHGCHGQRPRPLQRRLRRPDRALGPPAEERLFFDCGATRNPYKHEARRPSRTRSPSSSGGVHQMSWSHPWR